MEVKEHRLLLFMELYQNEFGVTLSRNEAHGMAMSLLSYARLFVKPLAEIKEDGITVLSNESE
jgi:hypothetical protein